MKIITNRTAPAACAWVAVLALLGSLGTAPLRAQETAGGEPVRLWLEVRDAKGRTPENLTMEDLEVSEGGVPVPITGLEAGALRRHAAAAEPTRFVLYFDQALASQGTVRRAAESFSLLAEELAGLGEVELVMAAEAPELTLATRDPLTLSERLSWTAINNQGQGLILALRQRTLEEVLRPAPTPLAPTTAADLVVGAIDEELELLRERREQLLAWLTTPDDRPRVVFLIADGFDLDPLAFYDQHLDTATMTAVLRQSTATLVLEAAVREEARALAASGWTVLPVAIAPAGGPGAIDSSLLETRGEDDQSSVGAGVTIRPGTLLRRRREAREPAAIPEAALLAPQEPLELIAAATGGEVVTSDSGLRDALTRFGDRYELTYQSSLRPDADLRRLEVRSLRPGLVVRTRRWLSRGLPAAMVAVKLRQLGAGVELEGGLAVNAVLRLDEAPEEESQRADLEVRLDMRDPDSELAKRADASFRVTIAVLSAGGESALRRELVAAQDLRGQEEWRYRTTMDLPTDAAEVAVLIEELTQDLWGGTRAAVVRGQWAELGEDFLPPPAVIELERPEKELLRGRVKFTTEVWDRRVDRVLFQLDERDVEEVRGPPFTARIDLGRTPRRQTLTVIAYAADGEELGRDAVVLNAGSGGFRVELVRPTDRQQTGPVDVEAHVAVPVERRLDRVLFFWNNEPAATLYAAPFRHRLTIPPARPMGYVRVVAMLDDGTVAEDVLLMNGPQAGERIDVNLVELYVVVTDRDGRPVRGLGREDFRIREDGVVQEISSFSDAGDLPLTLGMAIDSSSSMFVKLPRAQEAAVEFVRSVFSAQDRAFVVDFDSQPRLARALTDRPESVVQSIESLEANGRTALWEAIVFSLVQLQGVRGRKALVVFSDGADEDEEFPFRSCLSLARKMGVPIYLILMKKEPGEATGLSLLVRSLTSRVDRLVEATGGRVFYAREYRDLGEVYEEIEYELRSQYLLTYYPTRSEGGDAWRDVDVDVDGKDLRPRTLSGYWP